MMSTISLYSYTLANFQLTGFHVVCDTSKCINFVWLSRHNRVVHGRMPQLRRSQEDNRVWVFSFILDSISLLRTPTTRVQAL